MAKLEAPHATHTQKAEETSGPTLQLGQGMMRWPAEAANRLFCRPQIPAQVKTRGGPFLLNLDSVWHVLYLEQNSCPNGFPEGYPPFFVDVVADGVRRSSMMTVAGRNNGR